MIGLSKRKKLTIINTVARKLTYSMLNKESYNDNVDIIPIKMRLNGNELKEFLFDFVLVYSPHFFYNLKYLIVINYIFTLLLIIYVFTAHRIYLCSMYEKVGTSTNHMVYIIYHSILTSMNKNYV